MVEYVSGVVKGIDAGLLILSVGPFGLSIQVPANTAFVSGQSVTVYLQLHWNQDNGPSLYGFASPLEKSIFGIITSCSGMGPKVALAVLSDLGADQFLHAIQMADDKLLSTVSGIGPKKAEQMAVQLKHKVAHLIKSGVTIQGATAVKWHEISQVLESLNYTRTEITAALQYLNSEYAQQNLPFDGLIRHALSFLAKKG